jgi:hypothetical protein
VTWSEFVKYGTHRTAALVHSDRNKRFRYARSEKKWYRLGDFSVYKPTNDATEFFGGFEKLTDTLGTYYSHKILTWESQGEPPGEKTRRQELSNTVDRRVKRQTVSFTKKTTELAVLLRLGYGLRSEAWWEPELVCLHR